MPVSITKNKKDDSLICRMYHQAFPDENIIEIIELTEGYFNVAYKISSDKRSVICKIAPSIQVDIMTYEKNIMFSEVDSMKMVSEKSDAPVAKILFYDNSHTICDADYFFMEMLPGRSFDTVAKDMSKQEKDLIYCEIGKFTRMLNEITGDAFGYYGQTEKQGQNWYEVFRSMLEDVYGDADKKEISLPVTKRQVLELLEKEKGLFEKVKKPKFVHWDIWAGNVFVENGEITGIIDFERCLWADELMEVGFRTYDREKSFFAGYGIDQLDPEQERRARWYDAYLFLLACLESDYRQYENKDFSNWGKEMLKQWMADISCS
jgi:fructosamine-3-kinase